MNEGGFVKNVRVIFVGDELVAGYGDARALGWTGRVMARTLTDPPLMSFNLAVPGETTAELAQRWEEEVERRLDPEIECRLVIGLGSHDVEASSSLARTRLHLANLLDSAARLRLEPFVVGPPPRPGVRPWALEELSDAYADVTTRRGFRYVDTFHPLENHEQWNTDMELSGGYTPRQAGYGLMAWLVLHNGWHTWLGVRSANSTEQ
ncbi:lysophospholipase [Actinobaculum suis]|nr:lysophospholipase [Actinobaculum suis]OCA94615.1 lysophospholipase [Actinobaculum suis]OCA94927.1 lysophospholipase [Actinobaculum suis]